MQALQELQYWLCGGSLLEGRQRHQLQFTASSTVRLHSCQRAEYPPLPLSLARSRCSSTQGLLKMHGVSAAQLTTTDQRSITSPCKHPGCAAHSHRRSLCSLKEVSTQISTRRSDYDSERGQRQPAARREERNRGPGDRKRSAERRRRRLGFLRKGRKKCTQSGLGREEERREGKWREKGFGSVKRSSNILFTIVQATVSLIHFSAEKRSKT